MGLAAFVVLLVLSASGRSSSTCPTFRSLQADHHVLCEPDCLTHTEGNVYGTLDYHEDSHVCLAALHASAISERGGEVRVKRSTQVIRDFYGTVRNRIKSKNSMDANSRPYSVRRASGAEPEDLLPDVLLVHDSYRDSDLHVTCFSQDPDFALEKNLVKWDYSKNMGHKKADIQKRRAVFTFDDGLNYHALICKGRRPRTDVLAVVQFRKGNGGEHDPTYQAPAATFRASKGEALRIPLSKTSGMPSRVFLKKFPPSWPTDAPNWTLPLTFASAQPYHKAIYNAGSSQDGKIDHVHTQGAYFEIMVRDCPAQKYGPDCSSDCPVCHNGGVCDSHTGTCVCPPGYYGTSCQHACLPGWFGASCQLPCRRDLIGFQVPEEGKCSGLTFCVPAPYGCSCAPGYKGPACDEECDAGTYGVNCQGRCDGCAAGCHPVTGTCSSCTPGSSCTARPPAPTDLEAVVGRDSLNVTWRGSGDRGSVYFVSHQKVSCAILNKQEAEKQEVRTAAGVELTDLQLFTRYNVCVVASHGPDGGHSQPACIQPFTAPGVSSFTCTGYVDSATCYVTLAGTCAIISETDFTINVTVEAYLACNQSLVVHSAVVPNSSGARKEVTLKNVLPGQLYNASVVVTTSANQIVAEDRATFTTRPGTPTPVRDLTAGLVCPTQIQLFWNDPCPTNGRIRYFYIEPSGAVVYLQECQSSSAYQRCHTLEGLELNKAYQFKVQVNNGQWSEAAYVTASTVEAQPGPSHAVTESRNPQDLTLAVGTPTQPGGVLVNCSLSVQGTDHTCTREFHRKLSDVCPPPITQSSTVCPKFTGLTEGKLYTVETRCCNSKYCSESAMSLVATSPLPPALSAAPTVLESSNTTITIALPTLTRYGDGNSSLAVVVNRAEDGGGEEGEDLQASAVSLLEKALRRHTVNPKEASNSRRRRSDVMYYSDTWDECREPLRIAAVLTEDDSVFVIGDGQRYNGFLNCPLESQKSYEIGVLAQNSLLGETQYAWQEIPGVVRARDWKPSSLLPALVSVLVVLLLLVAVLAFVIYRHPALIQNFKSIFIKDQQESSLVLKGKNISFHDVSSLPDTASLAREDPVYENIDLQEIYDNDYRRVPRLAVESYLNRVIGSSEASDEFKTIPENTGRKMDVGNLPANKKKNRYRNNLPYDDTRVILAVKDDDPHSDYINANHIRGYGQKMHYIATQGPKAEKNNTIGDFWRMVWEQNVSSIIMVANFIENGKPKVAEYLRYGSNLETEEMTVTVVSRESLPHFILSRVCLVTHNGQQRELWHYQFISWPDHGVPGEALSLASMMRHFRASQPHGVAVVHCSAGIGRTGTVLLVLLLLDSLDLKDSIDPVEALARLRDSRARLVESFAQYSLALQILDEILFGASTTILLASLLEELPRLLLECPNQYRKLKALPSALTYKIAEQQNVFALTRNHAAYPSDTWRVCLAAQEGVHEAQYINAIRVTGLTNKEAFMVTEHPLASTSERFWRLVAEKCCPVVVFLNEFSDEEEFPAVLPDQEEERTFGQHRVRTHSVQPYSQFLLQARVTIANPENETYNTVVYQVTGWECGQDLPPSPDVALTLADLLLQVHRSPYSGPPLLCCGDGVTGCGLVAAVTLVLERAVNYQNVDIYRTAVALLRCRPQFITSVDQYSTLYQCASLYLENFSTYSNIS
ncbi:receptor-type tyrosine-protein phosphatase mu-like isoform X2 [Penaeus vannamei]|uniref:receptor-type tyrosine-protein phosphatase mu-like isoform X2 n=1 Tax=Penaeus vannamei TaxID=6689 RepID=UPI00387FA563